MKRDESERKVDVEMAKIRDEIERRLNEQKSKYEQEIGKLRSEVDQSKSELERKLSEQKLIFDQELNKLRSENAMLASQVQELSESKKRTDDDLKKIRNDVENIKRSQELKIGEVNTKLNEEVSKLKIETERINKIISCTKIFRHLSSLYNGQNVIDAQIIGYETTEVSDGSIRDLFDNSQDTSFRLNSKEGGYIIFDFKTKRVSLSKYYFSVPSQKTGRTDGQPKSWRIDGSNDKSSWDQIDVKDNDKSLHGYGFSNTFACSNVTGKYYRYIRIKEVISNYNDHHFLLAELEFYGSIENA